MTDVGSSRARRRDGRPCVRMPPASPQRHEASVAGRLRGPIAMKQCPFCAGVIPDASTICKHCKQSIPSARAGGRRSSSMWALLAILGVDHRDWRARRLLDAHEHASRRRHRHRPPGQFLEGLQAAQNIGTDGQAVRESDRRGRRLAQAEGRAGRKTPSGSMPARWRRSSRAAGGHRQARCRRRLATCATSSASNRPKPSAAACRRRGSTPPSA